MDELLSTQMMQSSVYKQFNVNTSLINISGTLVEIIQRPVSTMSQAFTIKLN